MVLRGAKTEQTTHKCISDLAFTVLSLYHVAEDYTKAKIKLFNKKNGIVYEIKGYKLSHKQSYTAS